MSCPKCGSQTQHHQKFCRLCGAGLQKTTRPLGTSAAVSGQAEYEGLSGSRLPLVGFIVMLIGIAIGATGKVLMHEDIVTVLGVIISLVGMALAVYPYLSPPRRRKPGSIKSSQPDVLTGSEPAGYLPHERSIEFVPSITERTTDLLEASAPTSKDKEDRESKA